MIIKPLPIAIALSLIATTSQAQQGMDHSAHAGHAAPADHGQMNHGQMDHRSMDHGQMDHGAMDHGSMDHGSMDHGSMAHPPASGIAPGEEDRKSVV